MKEDWASQRLLELGRLCGGWGGGGGPRSKLLLSALFSLGPLSPAPILFLGGSEETQPVHPPVSGSLFGLKNSRDLFPQTLFSSTQVQASRVKTKLGSIYPIFQVRELGTDIGQDLPEVPQLQIGHSVLSMLSQAAPSPSTR